MNVVALIVAVAAVVLGVLLGWWAASRTWQARMGEQEALIRREAEAEASALRMELTGAQGQLQLLVRQLHSVHFLRPLGSELR